MGISHIGRDHTRVSIDVIRLLVNLLLTSQNALPVGILGLFKLF